MFLRFGPDVRLRSRREYLTVQQAGRRISSRLLTVLALPNTLGRDRLGIVASKKIGGAVVRNRAKRRLRELFRQQDPSHAASAAGRPGFDLVVIARRELAVAPSDLLRADFRAALKRVGPRARS
jgi:ribonuclease P protein component